MISSIGGTAMVERESESKWDNELSVLPCRHEDFRYRCWHMISPMFRIILKTFGDLDNRWHNELPA